MISLPSQSTIFAILFWLVHFGFILRAVLRPHRNPQSRIAWVLVLTALPVVGIIAYLLLGETSVGPRRYARLQKIRELILSQEKLSNFEEDNTSKDFDSIFQVGKSVNGFPPVKGNQAILQADAQATINSIIADIDAAKDHVHISFYIWLSDHSGLAVAQALMRAAKRGVRCRALVDALGSRALIHSPHWQIMRDAGVHVAQAMPFGIPIIRILGGRLDLRNHRKIVVIDNSITYCGSQNCADAAFLPKAKFAPWVDVMVRFVGPVAMQNQALFASDWMTETNEDLSVLLISPTFALERGFAAQAIGTGPTLRYNSMSDVFQTMIFEARHELFITTPYYSPDEAIQSALCSCARRGVRTTIIFPLRNDSWIVGASSRSYYSELLAAGVRIFEYRPGLLHAKTLTIDGKYTLIGSANMDRRSLELNYENNILVHDVEFTQSLRARQEHYLSESVQIDDAAVRNWSIPHKAWVNTVAMLSPLL